MVALAQKDKKFKQFERELSRQVIFGYVRESNYFARLDEQTRRSQWKYHDQKRVWSQLEIHHAVYETSTVYEWQTFRIALKGLNTSEKLIVLERRWEDLVVQADGSHDEIEQCRIDNYINALARGGQLLADGSVAGSLNCLL